MVLNVLNQRPADLSPIQKSPMTSVIQCSSMCLSRMDCYFMAFGNEQCILYGQTLFKLQIDVGVDFWEKIDIS